MTIDTTTMTTTIDIMTELMTDTDTMMTEDTDNMMIDTEMTDMTITDTEMEIPESEPTLVESMKQLYDSDLFLDVMFREICTWEARLECNLSGYSSGGYDRIEWIREHDAYYPKDQFRDLMEYCGTRCSVDRDGTLVINNVKSEDKGVYRCYVAGGDKRDFMEVNCIMELFLYNLSSLQTGDVLSKVSTFFKR